MKVLYIGYFSAGTGWSKVAETNVRALMSAGVDVVCRDFRTFWKPKKIDDDIVECIKKDLSGIDVCIQHVLPKDLVKTGKYRNIAYLEYETHDIMNNPWREYLNMMDYVWVPNENLVDIVNENCRSTQGVYVPHTVDIAKYYESYKNVVIPELHHTYKFYTICDINDRKNLESTVKAFHAAFDRDEPVSLIIKSRWSLSTEEGLRKRITDLCTNVKRTSRLYKNLSSYKTEFIITSDLSGSEIMALHQYADCFINTSHGESWSVPTFDAMGMGKQIISSPSGPSQYLKDYKGSSILGTIDTLCRTYDPPLNYLYTGRDYWDGINERQLVEYMRSNYLNPASYKSEGLKCVKEYSLENVGKIMLKNLQENFI